MGGSNGNVVSGNSIGVDATGAAALSNLGGVEIVQSFGNLIGGDTAGEGNLISGNGSQGIYVFGPEATDNTVSGNRIGTDASGAAALGNDGEGILLSGDANHNLVGGDTPAERNVISGNHTHGVMLEDTQENQISGNYIGVASGGGTVLGNLIYGVLVSNGSGNNLIGGAAPGEGNVVSGNGQIGVVLEGTSTTDNVVSGNLIGTDASGGVPLGEQFHGVVIQDVARDNTIGGPTSAERNVIYGNINYGVGIWDAGTNQNLLMGNFIGVDIAGGGTPYNYGMGVVIDNGAHGNWVLGGIISHNGADGVSISGSTTTGNFVSESRNFVNDWQGINLVDGANGDLPAPGITSITQETSGFAIRGFSCGNCIVEVFGSRNDDGEGEFYLGNALTTTEGDFTLTVSMLPFPYLTATARHETLSTSEFSEVFVSPFHFVFLPLAVR